MVFGLSKKAKFISGKWTSLKHMIWVPFPLLIVYILCWSNFMILQDYHSSPQLHRDIIITHPCHIARVPMWVERAKNNVVLKKIELTFRKFQFRLWIRPSFLRYNHLKLGVLLFLMPIFQSIPALNGLNVFCYKVCA